MAGDMFIMASLFFQKKVHNFIRTKKGSCIALTDFGKKHPISSNPILEKGKQQFGKKLTPLFFLNKQLDPNKINPPQGAHGGGGCKQIRKSTATPHRRIDDFLLIFQIAIRRQSCTRKKTRLRCTYRARRALVGNRSRARGQSSAARIMRRRPQECTLASTM